MATGKYNERLAQARIVAQLNAAGVYGGFGTPGVGITPNLQWEAAVPGTQYDRPDLLLYDRNNASGTVGLVEMKGKWSPDDPIVEVTDYVNSWNTAATAVHGRTASAYHFTAPIDDRFEVEFGKPCKWDQSVYPAWLYHTYSDPSHDGVIWVDLTTTRECPEPIGVTTIGGSSDTQSADQHNHILYQGNVADFWSSVAGNPALWLLPGTAIPAVAYYALPSPVYVSWDASTVMMIEESVANAPPGDVDAIWQGIVNEMAQWAQQVSRGLAAGNAAQAGLDADEMAAAGELADAGFIDMTGLAIAGPLGLLLFSLIWALMHWHIHGDPHIATLDGLAYDMQTEGEFHLVEVPSLGLDIQGRFQPTAGETTVSYLTALAFAVNGSYVEIDQGGTASINDVPIGSKPQVIDLGGGAQLLYDGGTRYIVTFGADHATLAVDGTQFGFNIDPGVPTAGLLGDNDGRPGNDLALADGTSLTSTTPATLDGSYADSWRITDDTSAFDYTGDGTTEDFTDLAFPSNVVTLDDFAQSDRDAARQVCSSKGVPAGPQMDACVLDVAETGDATYATAAAAVTGFLQSPNDLTLDSSASLSESFGSTIAPNFAPDSTETIGGSVVAGPVFDGSGYSFSVPELPAHAQTTIAFDVYAVGLTSANAQDQSLTVHVSDPASSVVFGFTPTSASVTSGPATISLIGQGQTAQGAPYTEYRASISVTQYSSQLRVLLAPAGFRGVIGSSLALNNVSVGVTVVPPQTFATTLPLSVTPGAINGASVSGAGTFATPSSTDAYNFTVPAGGLRLALHLASCPAVGVGSGLTWTLATTSGTAVNSGGCGPDDLGYLDGGNYSLTVGDPGATGSYTFELEAPQVFPAALPLSVTSGTVNGSTVTGSGSFGDGASQQAYTFTVPAGGQPVRLGLSGCPSTPGGLPVTWALLATGSQATVQHGGCGYTDLGTLTGGGYELLVTSNGNSGTYTLVLDLPNVHTTSVPLVVAVNTLNGVTTPGVADFQDGARRDVYTFTVPAGGQPLNLYMSSAIAPITWKLVNSHATTLAVGGVGYTGLGMLPADTYELMVDGNGGLGNYSLTAESPQTFAAALPLTVSPDTLDGSAVPGVGSLQDVAAQQIYTFTVPAGGQPLDLNMSAWSGSQAGWALLNSSGAAIRAGTAGNRGLGNLVAGDYKLVVSANGGTGTYSVTLAPVSFPSVSQSPVSAWNLDDAPGSTAAADSSGLMHNATVSGSAAFTSARGGSATFTGSGGALTTSGPVTDTANSFSASLWVDLTAKDQYRTAMVQEGYNVSGFFLEYESDCDCWAFTRFLTDETMGSIAKALSPSGSAKLNTWTHLVGTYDASTGTLTLYVNGQEVATASDPTPFTTTGVVALGHGFYNGFAGNTWLGSLADARIYNRSLTAAEVGSLYTAQQVSGPSAALTVSTPAPQTPLAIRADAAASTPGASSISSYNFDFGDGTTSGSQTSATADHTYTTAGAYTVTVTVTDAYQLTAIHQSTVTVAAPPQAALTVTPPVGVAPMAVTADASGSHPGTNPIASYSFDFGDGTTSGSQASATASHTYGQPGPYTVTLTVTDSDGSISTTTAKVTAANHDPIGAWSLNDTPASTTAHDYSGHQHDGALSGSVGFTTQRGGSAAFTGAGGSITTSGPVVDTSGSFSVSLWAKLTTKDGYRTAIVQQGNQVSGFFLEYESDCDCWAFTRFLTDETFGGVAKALSPNGSAALGVWTHLVGTYSAGTGTLTLYVNGQAVGTATDSTPFNTSGPVVMGHGFYGGSPNNPWLGSLADAQVYNRAITAAEVGSLYSAQQVAPPTAVLSLTPASGTVPVAITADASASTPGASPITSYGFDWGDGTTTSAQSAATSSHTYTRPGIYTVTVTVADANQLVAVGTATASPTVSQTPIGTWNLDDPIGSATAHDSSGFGHDGTLSGSVAFASDHGGSAAFTGSGGSITTSGPVVDTSASFSVSLWADLATKDGYRTAMVQQGNQVSGFFLEYESDCDCWAFTRFLTDYTYGSVVKARSASGSAALNTWTHLVGTYDANSGAMTLYVDGQAVGSDVDHTPFATSGPVVMGHGFYSGGPNNPWIGSLSDARIYDRVLSATEVSDLYGS